MSSDRKKLTKREPNRKITSRNGHRCCCLSYRNSARGLACTMVKVTNAPEPNSWHTDLGTNLIVLLDVFFAVYGIAGYSRLLHQIKEGIRLENGVIALTTYRACRCVDSSKRSVGYHLKDLRKAFVSTAEVTESYFTIVSRRGYR